MCMLCALCDKPNARIYDLRVDAPGSAEQSKNSAKMVTMSPEAKSLQWINFFMCVSMEHKKADFSNISHE